MFLHAPRVSDIICEWERNKTNEEERAETVVVVAVNGFGF